MRTWMRVWGICGLCTMAAAAPKKRIEPSPSESLEVELPTEWKTRTVSEAPHLERESDGRLEFWVAPQASRELVADPGAVPAYTAGWLRNAGLAYLYQPEIGRWPAWLNLRLGANFAWMDRTRTTVVERASYVRDQKAYVLGLPLGIDGEFFTSGAWAASLVGEIGPQWAFRGDEDTAGGAERLLGWTLGARPTLRYRFRDAGLAALLGGVRVLRETWPQETTWGWSVELGARF